MKLCIIGCGNMGLIYAHFFAQQRIIEKQNIILIEKDEKRRKDLVSKKTGNIKLIEDGDIESSDIILLSVKPQDFDDLAPHLFGRLKNSCVVISIMAGVTLSSIQNKTGTQHVVRAMPNAPAMHGKGMTVFYCSEKLTDAQKQTAITLLSVTGKLIETVNEDLLNAVTALSGSGPAYFFYFAHQMIKEAVCLGVDEHTAETLVRQTLLGAATMLDLSEKTCNELVKVVASKGGTTEAALNLFEEKNMPDIISEALQRATKRSFELAK